jgi:hypothetical protein
VAFCPDVAFTVVIPVSVDPASMSMGWFNVGSGNPYVAISVPAVVAGVPCPVGVLVGCRRNDFMGSLRWSNTDDDLGLGDAYSEKKCAGESGEEFFHLANLLYC